MNVNDETTQHQKSNKRKFEDKFVSWNELIEQKEKKKNLCYLKDIETSGLSRSTLLIYRVSEIDEVITQGENDFIKWKRSQFHT